MIGIAESPYLGTLVQQGTVFDGVESDGVFEECVKIWRDLKRNRLFLAEKANESVYEKKRFPWWYEIRIKVKVQGAASVQGLPMPDCPKTAERYSSVTSTLSCFNVPSRERS